jgi:hypothetical protein
MAKSTRLGTVTMAAALGFVAAALGDDVGVPAKIVKALEKPGKSIIKVVWKDDAGLIHKGAAGDPALVSGSFELCISDTPVPGGAQIPALYLTQGPWVANTDRVAKYRSYDYPLRTIVVKNGKVAKVLVKGRRKERGPDSSRGCDAGNRTVASAGRVSLEHASAQGHTLNR